MDRLIHLLKNERIGRLEFLGRALGLLAMAALGVLAARWVGRFWPSADTTQWLRAVALVVGGVALCTIIVLAAIPRCRDLGWPPVAAALLPVPVLGPLLILALLLAPSKSVAAVRRP